MKIERWIAALAAAAPLALAAQVTIYQTPTTPAEEEPKKAYVPHKTPMKDTAKKDSTKKPAGPKKPEAPKKPAEPKKPEAPKKPSNVPPVIYDKQGNAIPTSPDAYDISSATKKK